MGRSREINSLSLPPLMNYFLVSQHNIPEIIPSSLMDVVAKRSVDFLRMLNYDMCQYFTGSEELGITKPI